MLYWRNSVNANLTFLLDNLAFFLLVDIEKAGAKLIYLSTYSTEFSPIENFWSKVKAILNQLYRFRK